ncbi:MAG: adenosylmethionine--8-amino-7-oxononanoate transaminase [Alphaproteobacteria bacterium]
MSLLTDDARYLWHPFTQHGHPETAFVPIVSGQGSYLYTEDGHKLLDLIASWWVITHGHSHPALIKAMAAQAAKLDQVIFAGFTHEPAITLGRGMQGALGRRDLWKLFFSDNGSTAVEVALKMALHAQNNWGYPEKKRFLAFQGGYHGDTVGAMSVGRSSGFFDPYQKLLFPVQTIDYPETWINDPDVLHKEEKSLSALTQHLKNGDIAGMILEPLIQGASGMRMCRPTFVNHVVRLCQQAGVLVIFDDVMTGFGRTGSLFAFHQLSETPDIVCLAKGLTGGMMPMSLTCASPQVFDAFLSTDFYRSLIHGHSFTANPIACAVANRSLALFHEDDTLKKIAAIEHVHRRAIATLESDGLAHRPRILGSVAAFDVTHECMPYNTEKNHALRALFLKSGLILRPLGGTLYLMPPYCTALDDLEEAYAQIATILTQVRP